MPILSIVTIYLLTQTSAMPAKPEAFNTLQSSPITCNARFCEGTYFGPEFINGEDIAHQFSNTMSTAVGDHLKVLFNHGNYSRVDFSGIKMITAGMGSGTVRYSLYIPIMTVSGRCDAYTSFDHVGGWRHKPALEARKKQLQKALMKGETLSVSELTFTDEGLQEHWIQWRHKVMQAQCERQ